MIAAVSIAVLFLISTQFTVVSFGTSSANGSTQVAFRRGNLSHLPFFASGEQMCSGAPDGPFGISGVKMCSGNLAINVRNGPNFLFGMPYMGVFNSLSMLFSAKR